VVYNLERFWIDDVDENDLHTQAELPMIGEALDFAFSIG
jgi:hypothetical protein